MNEDAKEINYVDLTDTEIYELPIELQACYLVFPWNKSANISTVEDWINSFYPFFGTDTEEIERKYAFSLKTLKTILKRSK